MYLLGKFASEQGSKDILKYTYQSSGYSDLELKFNPYYKFVHSFIPKWMPPSVISVVGQAFVFVALMRILLEDPSLTQDVDPRSYIYFAISIFIY